MPLLARISSKLLKAAITAIHLNTLPQLLSKSYLHTRKVANTNPQPAPNRQLSKVPKLTISLSSTSPDTKTSNLPKVNHTSKLELAPDSNPARPRPSRKVTNTLHLDSVNDLEHTRLNETERNIVLVLKNTVTFTNRTDTNTAKAD